MIQNHQRSVTLTAYNKVTKSQTILLDQINDHSTVINFLVATPPDRFTARQTIKPMVTRTYFKFHCMNANIHPGYFQPLKDMDCFEWLSWWYLPICAGKFLYFFLYLTVNHDHTSIRLQTQWLLQSNFEAKVERFLHTFVHFKMKINILQFKSFILIIDCAHHRTGLTSFATFIFAFSQAFKVIGIVSAPSINECNGFPQRWIKGVSVRQNILTHRAYNYLNSS